jgi:outer membrane protein W
MKLRILTALVSLLSASAMANNFQHQSSADYGSLDLDGADVSAWTLNHQYYFAPVNQNDSAPWAEAGFVNRASSVNGTFVRTNIDTPFGDVSANAWGLGGEYMDSRHDFYASAGVTMLNGSSANELTASAGFFVQKNWLVKADVFRSKDEEGDTMNDYGISTKALMPVMNGDFLVLTAAWRQFEATDSNGMELGADYYVRPYLSFGVEYSNDTDESDNTIGVNSQYFVNSNLALRGSLTRVDTGEEKETAMQLGASYRF